jgi:hypothetical protein
VGDIPRRRRSGSLRGGKDPQDFEDSFIGCAICPSHPIS